MYATAFIVKAYSYDKQKGTKFTIDKKKIPENNPVTNIDCVITFKM
jgi:hypothetical protein